MEYIKPALVNTIEKLKDELELDQKFIENNYYIKKYNTEKEHPNKNIWKENCKLVRKILGLPDYETIKQEPRNSLRYTEHLAVNKFIDDVKNINKHILDNLDKNKQASAINTILQILAKDNN